MAVENGFIGPAHGQDGFTLSRQKGGPPTAPLRPRVLTPRDHFVHRGGERTRIMQQSSQTFNKLGAAMIAGFFGRE